MAKKATTAAKTGSKKRSSTKAVSVRSGGNRSKSGSSDRKADGYASTAADALMKLLESPLVADLLAVGATAALAALAEHRYGRGKGSGAKRALKGAVTAAAGAIGRRIATEFDEVKKAARAKSAAAK
ncbi:MAG: hypothetical protein WKF52_02555 [Sphingomicrobium sp.]